MKELMEDQQRELARETRVHFDNGLPSVVLAVVTTLLTAVSYFWVQPNLVRRYEKMVASNLGQLKVPNVAFPEWTKRSDSPVDQKEVGPTGDRTMESSSHSQNATEVEAWNRTTEGSHLKTRDSNATKKQFEETALALRRFAFWDQTNSKIRYQEALLAEAAASWFEEQTRSLHLAIAEARRLGELDSETKIKKLTEDLRESEYKFVQETKKASDAMVAVQRRKGAFWQEAAMASIRSFMTERSPNDSKQVASVTDTLKSIMIAPSSSDNEKEAANLKAMLATDTALSLNRTLTVSDRTSLLQEATRLFEQFPPQSPDGRVFEVIAKCSLADSESANLAWQVAQDFWIDGNMEAVNRKTRISVFRSLLFSNGTEEAQSNLSKWLNSASPIEQSSLRPQAAKAATAWLVSQSLAATLGKTKLNAREQKDRDDRIVQVLNMLVRLAPESSLMLDVAQEMLDVHLDPEAPSDNFHLGSLWIKALTANGDRDGINNLLNALNRLLRDEVRFEQDVCRTLADDSSLAVLAVNLIILFEQQQKVESQVAIDCLLSIDEATHNIPMAVSARAGLHIKRNEIQEAIACFENLEKRYPGNAEVRESLNELRKMISKP